MDAKLTLYGHRQTDDTMTREAWVSYPLDDLWTTFLRLVPHEGRPVIAEVRIVPTAGLTGEPHPADWSGDPGNVPPGGFTARAIRQFRTDRWFPLLAQIVADWNRMPGGPELLEMHGIDPDPKRQKPRRGRPTSRTPEQLARIAQLYVETLIEEPRRTMRALAPKLVAEGLGGDVAAAKTAVQAARRAGMLTKGRRGVPGGELTDKALKILEGEAR